MTPEQLAHRLQAALPEALRSVVLYGSAAAGDFVPGKSDYDVLVIAEPLGAAELDRLGPVLTDWVAADNELPMLFSQTEFAASADTFPIEFADMQQSRQMLFGVDVLREITIDPAHLRLQLERELKGKLLSLRRHYVLARLDNDRLVSVMTHSLTTFLVLMRAALRLFRTDPPALKLDALTELSQHLAFDPQPFRTVHTVKMRGRLPLGQNGRTMFAEYLRACEQVVSTIDRHVHRPAASPHV